MSYDRDDAPIRHQVSGYRQLMYLKVYMSTLFRIQLQIDMYQNELKMININPVFFFAKRLDTLKYVPQNQNTLKYFTLSTPSDLCIYLKVALNLLIPSSSSSSLPATVRYEYLPHPWYEQIITNNTLNSYKSQG